MFRKVVIGVGALLTLAIVVAIALVVFVDVNRFKPQIAQFAADRYQRTLRFDGDLSLSVFPRLAIALPATTLSEPGNDTVAARIASARVAVALMPLLRGRLIADRVVLDELDARVVRMKDGRLSVDDLLGRGTAAAAEPAARPPAAPAGDGKAGSGPGSTMLQDLDIGGITISRARVVFEDRQADHRVTLSNLSLESGRIAPSVPIPVTLAFNAVTTRPAASLEVTLKTGASINAVAGTPAGSPIATLVDPELRVQGLFDAQPIDLRLSAPRLTVGDVAIAADRLTVAASLGGRGSMATGGATGGATATAGRIAATLAAPLAGDLSAGRWRLAPIAGDTVLDDPARAGKPARIAVSGSLEADTVRETVATDLTMKVEESTLTLKADARGFERPKATLALTADRLDLDRWLPPPAPAARPQGSAPGQPQPGATPPATPPVVAGAPIDFGALDAIDMTGRVRVGELRARGLVATDLSVDLAAAGGQLKVAPIAASLYQGRLAGQVTVRSRSNETRADLRLTGIAIAPLLAALSGRDLLEGRGDLRIDVGTAGPTTDAMVRALDGQVALSLADGAIRGINLAETLRGARDLLRGGSVQSQQSDRSRKTDFTALSVSFALNDGVATSRDLDVRSPLFRIGGEGRIDLPADRIDYTVRASVVGTSTGQGGRDLDDLRGVTIPVQLTGAIAAPSWRIDWVSAGRDALKSRAAEELKERLKSDPRIEQLEDKARERLGDSLRGLFRR